MAKTKRRELNGDDGTVSVEAVNHQQGLCLVMKGEDAFMLPITNYFDEDGNEVEDCDYATCFVAGNADCWITVPLDIFENGVYH